jgi:hypothetical protein
MSQGSSSRRKAVRLKTERQKKFRDRFTPKPGQKAWGIVDTHEDHNVWMGTPKGPFLYNDEMVAKIAARTIDVQLCQSAGQSRAKEYDGSGTKHKDDKKVFIRAEEALRRLEEGLVI